MLPWQLADFFFQYLILVDLKLILFQAKKKK